MNPIWLLFVKSHKNRTATWAQRRLSLIAWLHFMMRIFEAINHEDIVWGLKYHKPVWYILLHFAPSVTNFSTIDWLIEQTTE